MIVLRPVNNRRSRERAMPLVYGIGNPLLDILAQVQVRDLEAAEAVPGSMNLVDAGRQRGLLDRFPAVRMQPGGSCANTLRGLAWLGEGRQRENRFAYFGAVGMDEEGDFFRESLMKLGIVAPLARKETPTGTSVILVTPDQERTMFTHLGACRSFTVEDLDFDLLREADILYFTGYMWDTDNQKSAVIQAAEQARQAGAKIVFDLADPFVVGRYGGELASWMPGRVDLLLANREELSAMTGQAREGGVRIIDDAMRFAPMVAMKVGKEGCLLGWDDNRLAVPGEAVRARDTTGAGDSFAAGFLHGMISGFDLERCGRLANRIASRIVTVDGCDYDALDRDQVMEGI